MRVLTFLIISILISSSIFANNKTNDDQAIEGEEEATKRALTILGKEIGADESDLVLIHLSRMDWPDSALGCPQAGMMYSQAIVPGYLALLKHDEKAYRVHLGNGRGLVCTLKQMPLRMDELLLERLRKIAIQDLADNLGVEIDNITVVEEHAKVWPDTGFGCSANPDSVVRKNVRGYLITLEYQGRHFEYRSSRSQVKPCPAIESD